MTDRAEELKEIMNVDKAARNQKVKIQDHVKTEPFIDHLYSEQQFEHLIFLECRRTNMLLEKLIKMLSDSRQGIKKDVSIPPTIDESRKNYLKPVEASTELPSLEKKFVRPKRSVKKV